MNKLEELLKYLSEKHLELIPYINEKVELLNSKLSRESGELFSEKHNLLITYADQFQGGENSHISNLAEFTKKNLSDCISHVHLLPFYPYTSDDGFSPTCYQEVDKESGSWEDVSKFDRSLMFDCVFNHMSKSSDFFKRALNEEEPYYSFFHIVEPEVFESQEFQDNIDKIVRPRTLPLFHKFKFKSGDKYVWTTFSEDQVDTNFDNIEFFKYLIDTFLLYIENGCRWFRIDAVPFMWKELGTNCSHLPKTHTVVKIFRAISELVKVKTLIITESNVPHHENITYWGNGDDEAQVIYNFSLAPLVLYSLTNQDSTAINKWASDLKTFGDQTTLLNFTSTHDGIGMRGLEGVVPDSEIFKLCDITEAKGGKVGKKKSRNGESRPYELNITWASFLSDENLDEDTFVKKVVNSHGIVMFYPGIGAHYIHNFFGSKNWTEGVASSGIPRRTNRRKFEFPRDLSNYESKVFNSLKDLIKEKSKYSCFAPTASIEVLDIDKRVIAIRRFNEEISKTVIFNLTESSVELKSFDVELLPYELKLI